MSDDKKSQEPEGCTHDCSTCPENCSARQGGTSQESFAAPANSLSDVKRVIAVVSGKGGVGKSLVTSMMAVNSARHGYSTAILDADVTGPSIPRIFGLKAGVEGTDDGMYPVRTKTGIEVMSVNLLLPDEKTPVVWRGPVIASTVKQFWSGVIWNKVDYMYVDMPPGTGDVPLTVFQSLPVSGIIVVTSPQELVSMIVAKAVKMAGMMNIPVLGVVENYSYAVCPDCGKHFPVFGESKIDEVAKEFGVEVLGRLPVDTKLASLCDRGMIELMDNDYLGQASKMLEEKLKNI